MFLFHSKKRNPHDTGCFGLHVFVAIVLVFASVIAFAGVLLAHVDPRNGQIMVGTPGGSLAIIALALSITLWMNQMKACSSDCDACVLENGKKKR